jgi:hypothetical protein
MSRFLLPLISWNNEWLDLGSAQPPGILLGLTGEKGEGCNCDSSVGEGCNGDGSVGEGCNGDGSAGEGCDGKGACVGM